MFNFNFQDLNIQALTQFFQVHPYSAGIFTYLVCFAEAMAVIGAIVPGVIAMPAIGFLIGSSLIPVGSTFLWAILGALTGDILSYFLGIYFRDRIHRMWPFTRWPNLLVRSEKFFHLHGGKSVFIGRFVGPTRAMIPMIAGMLNMSFVRFSLAIVPSAVIWAIGYMAPGVLLGALSLELPKKAAAEFTVGAFLAIIVLWLVVWVIQHFFKQLRRMFDHYIMRLWRLVQKHHKWCWITKILSDPKEPDNHNQLTLVMLVVLMIVLFLWISFQVLLSGALVDFGYMVYHLLSSLRVEFVDQIFVLIALFGDLPLILAASGVVFLWLVWKRQWYVAWHWFAIIAGTGFIVTGMKFLIDSSRPGEILYEMYSPSFPSAHATFSTAFYGFLAVIMARELKPSKKCFPYIVAGVLAALIYFSRLYLGAHWVIDVVGGILLGLIMLLINIISYRRRHILHLKIREFTLIVVSAFILTWVGYSAIEFDRQFKKYALFWPQQSVKFNDLIKNGEGAPKIPLYRLNRLGKPIEAFNVAYIGALAEISQTLQAKGWKEQATSLNFQNMLRSFSQTSIENHLTILPQLYHNKKVALLFTKTTDHDGEILILRLWLSEIVFKDSNLSVWIGTIENHHATANIFSLKHLRDGHRHIFRGATGALARCLEGGNFYLWKKKYTFEQQPQEMQGLQWDGSLLIIKSKKQH